MPFVVTLILIFVLATCCFAIIGLIAVFEKLFGSKSTPQQNASNDSLVRKPKDDAQATGRLLSYLRLSNKIPQPIYEEIRETLVKEFPNEFPTEFPNEVFSQAVQATRNDQTAERVDATDASILDVPTPSSPTTTNSNDQIIETASLVRPGQRVAPWDLPDPPEPEPRRTIKEMMAGFMLEKNIRWGELASGILIVGSAVGLVVSLRNELQDTIPYFSAIMFLLITAAIHGAGIYTLKKWRLRNTSRGTLIIGLLLIPLNFLAACILSSHGSDRRELTDPLLWTAISVGMVSFGAMAWYSGKCLLRRGQLPIFLTILGAAIGTLIINRSANTDASTLRKLWLTVPLMISFFAGTILIIRNQWTRPRWPQRASFRVFIVLGIATFAYFVGASLLLIRATDKPSAIVALAPSLALVAILSSWLGHIIWQGSCGTDAKTIGVSGLSLHILGLFVAAAAWIASFNNPAILLVTSGILGLSLLMFAIHRQESRLLIGGWIALGSFVLCALNLIRGTLQWDVWASMNELAHATLNGQSAICLMLVGAVVIGIHILVRRRHPQLRQFFVAGIVSGGVLSGLGCLCSLTASFMNRNNLFDNMTATTLLSISSLAAIYGCFQFSRSGRSGRSDRSGRSGQRRSGELHSGHLESAAATESTELAASTTIATASDQPNTDQPNTNTNTNQHKTTPPPIPLSSVLAFGTAALLLGCLLHAFIWNPTLADWLNKIAFSINGNRSLVMGMHALILAISSAVFYAVRNRDSQTTPCSVTANFAYLSMWTGTAALVGSLFLIDHQTGLGTFIVCTIAFCSLLFTWVQQNSTPVVLRHWSITTFVLTAACVSVVVVEILTRTDWCPDVSQPRHWLIQISALSIWLKGCLVITWLMNRTSKFKRFAVVGQGFTIACGLLLTFGFTLLTSTFLFAECNLELFNDAAAPRLSLAGDAYWSIAAAGILIAALMFSLFRYPVLPLGVALLAAWTLAWSLGALCFADARAVATGIRWLVPIGGAIGALLVAGRKPAIPLWVATRNKFGLGGRSTWKSSSTQDLISLSLAVSSVIVLGISTIAIARVMMNGGVEALGGPLKSTLFGDMKKDVSYGLPVAIIVNTFLLFAISERRKWLATAGSAVFQYCVMLSVVLLFISPHPKLASSWFINILQAVSVGMTGYGFAWWYFRGRIEENHQSAAVAPADDSTDDSTAASSANTASTNNESRWNNKSRWSKLSQLEIHTCINGFLITSLAVLVISRFFRYPQQTGDWINSVGGPLGMAALVLFGVLVALVWWQQIRDAKRTSIWMWLSCWAGIALVGMLAAFFDRMIATDSVAQTYRPWLTFNLIMWGSVAVCLGQVLLLFMADRWQAIASGTEHKWDGEVGQPNNHPENQPNTPPRPSRMFVSQSHPLPYGPPRPRPSLMHVTGSHLWLPLLLAGTIAFLFAFRGMSSNPAGIWNYLAATGCLIALATVAGFICQSGLLGFVSAGLAMIGTLFLIQIDPNNWFGGNLFSQPATFNLVGLSLLVVAMIWCGYFIFQTVFRKRRMRLAMVWMPNVVTMVVAVSCLLVALFQWAIDSSFGSGGANFIRNGAGFVLFVAMGLLLIMQLWNGARKGLAISGMLWWFATIIFVVITALPDEGIRESCVVLGLGCGVAGLGWFWIARDRWLAVLRKSQAPTLVRLERSLYQQMPIVGLVVGIFIVGASLLAIFTNNIRLERFLTVFGTLGLAIGTGCWANSARRRSLQGVTLYLITLTMILISWANLNLSDIRSDTTSLFVRMLIVLAIAMFIYGGLVTRWVRHSDHWLKSLREMATVNCGLAIACFGIVLAHEFSNFVPDKGCGMVLAEAVAITFAVIGMGMGLLLIAVRPEHDPFALSLQGRMGYVYVAQLVAAMLVVHLYLTMPFLFQIGIRHYWPYLAMLLCFGGVGVAHVLEKRNLTVLGQPLFNTAAVLPILVAVLIWGIDSRADHALVTLMAGLAYLMLSYTHRSVLSGVGAVLLGNLAIWLFYNKFDGFSFLDHPQLWLIPPAVSVLIAAQISRARLTAPQLAMVRYLCVITIYLSSTSEIFINGLGNQLWPPMILALLSVAGIMLGIMLQVRAFLYLGALFLLMAMVMMVSHAQQRLDHVWPWWAFGVTLGIAILVMFGLFEKRKNDLRQVLGQLRQWDL